MAKEFQVFEPGCNVFLDGLKEPIAFVAAVTIQPGRRIQYQVVWWDGTSRHCEWLEEFELRATANTPTVQIGFCGGAT